MDAMLRFLGNKWTRYLPSRGGKYREEGWKDPERGQRAGVGLMLSWGGGIHHSRRTFLSPCSASGGALTLVPRVERNNLGASGAVFSRGEVDSLGVIWP